MHKYLHYSQLSHTEVFVLILIGKHLSAWEEYEDEFRTKIFRRSMAKEDWGINFDSNGPENPKTLIISKITWFSDSNKPISE